MRIAADRGAIERTRIGYSHGLMSFPIFIKAGRKRINVAKEVATVNKLRLSLERSLTARMIQLFNNVGNRAARSVESGSTIDGALNDMRSTLTNILRAHHTSVIETFAAFANQDRKADSPFQRLIDKYHTTYTAQKVTGITETTRVMIQSVILSADEEGLGVAGTAKLIREFADGNISRARAATIARTETHGAASWAQHEQHKENDFPMIKRWVSVSDARTREHHSAMNGKEVKMDEDFEVVYRGTVYPMAYTHDPRGGAANNINCRCVTLYFADDDVVFDDQPTEPDAPAPVPEPAPVVAINRNAPIQPQNLASLTILKKSAVKKQLGVELEEAAADERYFNKTTTVYRDVNPKHFGKAVFSTDLTDESATVILAVKKEIDEICDRVELPHIRSIVVHKSRKYNMAMGDGILYIDHDYVNELTASYKRSRFTQADIDAETRRINTEIDELKQAHEANEASMLNARERALAIRKRASEFNTRDEYRNAYNSVVDEFNKFRRKNNQIYNRREKLRIELSKLGKPVELKVSDWNPTLPIMDRPHSGKDYLADALDRIRHTMYHEIGHQIHQTYKMTVSQRWLDGPLAQRGREPGFGDVSRPLDRWLTNSDNEKILYGGGRRGILHDVEAAKQTWSTYGNYNGAEWFAENNANYWMGFRERVDPKFTKLIEAVLRGDEISDRIFR